MNIVEASMLFGYLLAVRPSILSRLSSVMYFLPMFVSDDIIGHVLYVFERRAF